MHAQSGRPEIHQKAEFIGGRDFRTTKTRTSPFRWILSHVFRYKIYILLTIVLQLVATFLQTLIPVFIGIAVAVLYRGEADAINQLLSLSLFTLISGVLVGVLNLARIFATEVLSQRIERDARDELFSSLIGKSLTFHDKQKIGDIMSRAAQDVRQLNFMINPGFSLVFSSILGIILPLIFIGGLEPELLLIPVAFVIAFLVMLRGYNKKFESVNWEQRKSAGKIASRLNEVISPAGMYVVRGASQEDQERKIFEKNILEFKGLSVKSGTILAKYWPTLILGVATVFALYHSLFLLQQGRISIDELVIFLGEMQLLRFPIFINIFAITVLSMGVASARRILEVMNEATHIDSNPSGYSGKIKGHITFDNVTFGYSPEVPVLKGISFTVHPGETVALVGMTGAGKTTISKLLSRLYDPQQGTISIDGVDLKEWSLEAVRSQIGLVEQDIFLFSKSIKENVVLGLNKADINEEKLIQATKLAQADEFIRALPKGYDSVIGERGITLSGGQRQRIAIARAILRDPSILILDDATSSIDSKTEDEIQTAIKNVLKNRVSFLITHRIAQIRRASLIILIDRGTIIGKGSHEELLNKSPKYREIFSSVDGFDSGVVAVRPEVT
ncbi:MAG TPA: ABC transporter ATP-binding protein [Candidatus Hodarchaeales archaeon]|nr:ABC transporter ATP-binding protein [Candidatus Hodarchaeales archaeon]